MSAGERKSKISVKLRFCNDILTCAGVDVQLNFSTYVWVCVGVEWCVCVEWCVWGGARVWDGVRVWAGVCMCCC